MQIVHPTPAQADRLVRTMAALVTVEGRVSALPIEIDCIDAIQRHMLALADPLPATAGPVPPDLADIVSDGVMRRQLVRFLAILAVMDRQVSPDKVAVVERVAANLGVQEFGVRLLRLAAEKRYKRITFLLMGRFVNWWAKKDKAGFLDWVRFLRWMLPPLHTKETTQHNKDLLAKFQALGDLAPGTFGRTLHRFYVENDIALPGAPKSMPWSMHEVYHVIAELGVALEAELLLTAFIGGTQEDTCLDQVIFGLLSYHAGRQIVGGVIGEGLVDPQSYFYAMARGAHINVDLVNGWSLWDVVELPMAEVRRRYNLPPIDASERGRIQEYNGLLTGPGHSTPEPALAA